MHTYKGLGLRSASPLLILRIVGAPFLFLGKLCFVTKKNPPTVPNGYGSGTQGIAGCGRASRRGGPVATTGATRGLKAFHRLRDCEEDMD